MEVEKHYTPRVAKQKALSTVVTGNKKKHKSEQQQSPKKYCFEEKIRYYVHKIKSWYQVIATGLSLADPRHEDGSSAARYLHKTCMNDFTVVEILEVMSLLPYLCPYYRFSAYHEYARFRCVCSGEENCTPVGSDFKLFCKRTCDESP
ncbi:Hypothetical predicted protein [Paramuricea clavata]|uniref:Uncharacterized protein n=1 Tax=Paramuricea clavata TaxID=317549 RepID=A0A6S7IAV6_PARCT|nr:Hypothetical predicted protein [Paramuricea clavata]